MFPCTKKSKFKNVPANVFLFSVFFLLRRVSEVPLNFLRKTAFFGRTKRRTARGGKVAFPTDSFTISEPQNSSNDISELHKVYHLRMLRLDNCEMFGQVSPMCACTSHVRPSSVPNNHDPTNANVRSSQIFLFILLIASLG